MFHHVVKGGFTAADLARVEAFAAALPEEPGTTVEEDDYSTRLCLLRWFHYGTEAFSWTRDIVYAALVKAGIPRNPGWECENIQHTCYGRGHFHNWHIDTFRRSYNRYDMPLGDRFIGKARRISVSVLLNDSSEFTGGAFEISLFPNGPRNTVGTPLADFCHAGDVAIFDSGLCHRVAPVESGIRRSLVTWICA